jgi:hypothetical protein
MRSSGSMTSSRDDGRLIYTRQTGASLPSRTWEQEFCSIIGTIYPLLDLSARA